MTVNYGSDVLWAGGDLQPGQVATGLALVLQHLEIRLTTPRGSCPDAPNDGLDVREFLHDAHTPTGLASIPGRVHAEATKDDRIDRLEVRASFLDGVLTLRLTGVTSNADEFELVALVDELTVKFLRGGQ